MAYRDFREWIAALEREKELLRIKEEINLEPDVGAIGGAVSVINGPGILAERIAGYDRAKLTISLIGTLQRAAMAVGLPKTASPEEQKAVWAEAYNRYPLKPRLVAKKDAPCKENILRGDELNLFKFPIPRINTHDAAPYITKTMCITRDPDQDWVNFGMYRLMVLDRNRTSIMTSHTSHWGQHYTKHRRQGKPMEMAVALGTDPVLASVSAIPIPEGWNEFDFAGALRGEPVEIVKAESVDLPVPANAEIVLEGTVTSEANVFEGPFGEFTGAYSGALMMPAFEISTITHRNDPIYDTVWMGLGGGSDGHWMSIMPKCVAIEQELKRLCPSVIQVTFLRARYLSAVIQGRWSNKTEPRHMMMAFWSSRASVQSKMVVVVDEDIDPWNADEVMWAIATRCQADKDVFMVPQTHCRLDPSVEVDGTTCKFGIDATKSREPHPRHTVSEWITPRKETEAWKGKLLELMKGGKS